MNITFEQLIGVKCALANKKKNQITSDLGKTSNYLSRYIDKDKLEELDDYFNKIDPEINKICIKLQESNLLQVQESESIYLKAEKKEDNSRLINHLLDEIEKKDRRIEELEAPKQYKQAR